MTCMRIRSASVRNFRSITKEAQFELRDQTILVGPNNEGKSNLIRALAVAMGVIQRWAEIRGDGGNSGTALTGEDYRVITTGIADVRGIPLATGYSWVEDYPQSKQGVSGSHPTTIRIDFELDDSENDALQQSLGIYNNGSMPIRITLKRDSVILEILKPGKGKGTYTAKSKELAKFITDHLAFVFIPAVRTGDQAVAIANEIVRNRTESLLDQTEYEELLERLNDLRLEAISQIESELLDSVKLYIPTVEEIRLNNRRLQHTDTVRSMSVSDPIATDLLLKGDGVKSLITIALLQELAKDKGAEHSIFLALDEPEAHLHPTAIREIETLLRQIATEQQVLVATHNPLLVNRDHIPSNVVVEGNQAKVARDIAAIRRTLGVQGGDNLSSAELVVLVEGLTDEAILRTVLSDLSEDVRVAVAEHRIVFKATQGASKIPTQILAEKSNLSKIVVVVDKDDAGLREAKKIIETNILEKKDIFHIGGLKNQVEIEDLVKPEVYLSDLRDLFERDLVESDFDGRAKWSMRLSLALTRKGFVDFTDQDENRAKMAVAAAVVKHGAESIQDRYVENLNSLAGVLVRKLKDENS